MVKLLKAAGMIMLGIILDRYVSTWVAAAFVLLWLGSEMSSHRMQIGALYGRLRRYGEARKMETILLCVLIGIVVGGLVGLGSGLLLTRQVTATPVGPDKKGESPVSQTGKATEPEPDSQSMPAGNSQRAEKTKPREPVPPTVSAPGGIAIGRDNLGTAIVNPPVNPYAPVVTYDFNGTKHIQQANEVKAVIGEESEVFQKFVELEKQKDWPALLDASETQIKKTPEWLTPYLFAGVALAHMGRRNEAIQRVEYVVEKSAGREDYEDARRILVELRRPQG